MQETKLESTSEESNKNSKSTKQRHSFVSLIPTSAMSTEDNNILELEFMAKSKVSKEKKRYSLGISNPFNSEGSPRRKSSVRSNQVLNQNQQNAMNNSSQEIFMGL